MKFACDLKRHEARSTEHIQQAAALGIPQASYLHDRDTEAIVAQNWRVVDRASSLLPSNVIKEWTSEYEQKQAPPSDFVDLFPPTSERGRPPSKKNAYYFENQHHGKLGPASVAAYALHHDRNLSSRIDPANVLWTQLVTYLGGRLQSAKDRNIFATVLRHAVDSSVSAAQSSSEESPPKYMDLPIPADPKQFNKIYVTGKHSVPDNVPRPAPEQLVGGFAYIPVTESVRDVFAHGLFVEPLIDNLEGLFPAEAFDQLIHSASEKGRKIMRNAKAAMARNHSSRTCYTCAVILWSDGFDPSTGAKSNRGSVWCCFVSIATPGSDVHSGCTTYLAAIGPSSGCRDEVEYRIAEDLKVLACARESAYPLTVYHGVLKKEVEVFVQLYAILQDRPERSLSTRILSGNSILTARWGHTGQLSSAYNSLPACEICFRERLLHNCPIASCDECHNWSFEKLCYPAPADYPTDNGDDFLEAGIRMLKFKKITIAGLKAACSKYTV
jgi:hypothetical protein